MSLRSSRAMVIGIGALGSPAATYIAAAGVGQIGLVDGGVVELTADRGEPKAESAAAKLALINREAMIESYPAVLDEANAEAIVMGADVIVDCTGSAEAHLAVNDACCAQGIPLVVADVAGFGATVLSVRPGESACYRCAFPDPPAEAETLGAMAGIVGSVQALEALKLLGGFGEPLLDRILRVDGGSLESTLEPAGRRDGCPGCARVPSSVG